MMKHPPKPIPRPKPWDWEDRTGQSSVSQEVAIKHRIRSKATKRAWVSRKRRMALMKAAKSHQEHQP